MEDQVFKATIILKTALDFNAQVIAIAAGAIASKNVNARNVNREIVRAFNDYQAKISKILEVAVNKEN